MTSLLVPCDGSASALQAVRHAATVATQSQLDIGLLHVIEPMTPVTLSEAIAARKLDERFPPQAVEALQPAAGILDQAGMGYTLHCRFGQPAAEIAAHARGSGSRALVMGTRGRGALASLVLGSVATQVVNLVDVPVTLVREAGDDVHSGDRTRTILVPCDGSDNALRAVRHAAGLARHHRAVRVDLLHVLDPTASPSHAGLSPEELLLVDATVRALRPAREILDGDGLPYEAHCRIGDPASQIADHLHDSGSSQVVMGTRGLGLMGNVLIGSVASRVASYAQVPVTLVK